MTYADIYRKVSSQPGFHPIAFISAFRREVEIAKRGGVATYRKLTGTK